MLTAPLHPSPSGPPRQRAEARSVLAAGSPVARPGAEARPGATLALAVVTVASAAGLSRVFSNPAWTGPVIITLLAVHFLCWALRRIRVGQLASVPVVAAGVALMASWTILGHSTNHGVPTGRTWHQAVLALHDLSHEFASLVPRVPATRAFELLAVVGAGLTAAIADWAAFRWKTPLAALVPELATFIFCSTSGVGSGRGALIGLEVAAMCGFLLVERATNAEVHVWFAGIRSGVGPWVVATGGLVAAAAVAAAVALSPVLAPRDGAGFLGWRSGDGANGGDRIVPNPLVDIRTKLTTYRNTPVFIVSSSVPSYWRLTSLDTFDGTTWTSTGDYQGFGSRLPGSPPPGAAVRTVRATFQIQGLDSVWLPAQFNPFAVQGVRRVSYDPASDSLLTSSSTSDRLQYSVSSYQYIDTLSGTELAAAPPVAGEAGLAESLQLPQTVDGAVTELARSITAGLTSEYAKAVAIQDYLRGPAFSYSLNPTTDGSGNQALFNFLFVTRSGYCQQYAAAYAVMARSVGLPTRVAVGFVQGEPIAGGGFQVRDADLHTWPEVYFGPQFGWVPFEPTKGFSVPGSGGYSPPGGSSIGPVSPATTVPVTGPTTPSSAPRTGPKSSHPVAPTTAPNLTRVRASGGFDSWWLAVPGALVAWVGSRWAGPRLARRARRRRARRDGTRAVVLNAWNEVSSDLIWSGIRRRPDETYDEFAQRAAGALSRLGVDGTLTYGGIESLAVMARRAAFAASVPPGLDGQAEVAANEFIRRLAAATPRSRRLRRLWSLRPGSWEQVADRLRRGRGGAGQQGDGDRGLLQSSSA